MENYIPTIMAILIAFISARNDSKKINSEITAQLINSVKETIALREKDIDFLTDKVNDLETTQRLLTEYNEYLWAWINKSRVKNKPKSFSEWRTEFSAPQKQ